MMYVTSIGFFVKEKKGKRRKKGREKKRKKMQEIWFVGFILAEGKREKKKKLCRKFLYVCVLYGSNSGNNNKLWVGQWEILQYWLLRGCDWSEYMKILNFSTVLPD